jgi:hypothetical protein
LKPRKNKKDITFIDYCRFVMREKKIFLERESERYVYEERKREQYIEKERQREQYVERETLKAKL